MAIRTGIGKTICNLCLTRCGLNVKVKNGRIIGVEAMPEHPVHQVCLKSQAIADLVYHKDRITEPMLKINGKWHIVSWDEALDFIAGKLTRMTDKYGARSLAVHLGFPLIGTASLLLAQRFFDAFESPNFTTGSSLCSWAEGMAQSITFNHNAVFLSPSFCGSKCVIVWGFNPTESSLFHLAGINQSRKEGAKLVVIDPRRIPLAVQADIHAQIRPGTDAALALGMLNVIIGEQLYDKEFVSRWTSGFDQLEEHVRQYPPEKVAEITWVSADSVRSMARMYAAHHPACIVQGVALDHSTNGIQTSRAISCLIALCGNYDAIGGNLPCTPLRQKNMRLRKGTSGEIGASFPLFSQIVGESSSAPMVNAILSGNPYPIKALIINGSNIRLIWPETKKVERALKELELLVVMDMFLNETANLANVFLPASSFVESTMLKDYASKNFPLVVLSQKVIEPLGSSLPDWKFWVALARKMGYTLDFPWETDDELYRDLLGPSGITLEQLKEAPGGVFYDRSKERQYLEQGFHTPSGKAEIYSELMARHGYDPLPTYHEPAESPVSRPRLVKKYPFILITGPRVGVYTHSQLRNIESMRRLHPEPLAQIHPHTARKVGVADRDLIEIETKRGKAEMKVQLTPDILPGVVCLPHGWSSKANANLLTSLDELDPVSGFPAFKSMLCRITKI